MVALHKVVFIIYRNYNLRYIKDHVNQFVSKIVFRSTIIYQAVKFINESTAKIDIAKISKY